MYVYVKSEPRLWTVGFYDPQGNWFAESNHSTPEAAANRIHWLNGGQRAPTESDIQEALNYGRYFGGRP